MVAAARPSGKNTFSRLVRKLSDDAKCADCQQGPPTHICLDFQTAICRECSDVHTEFRHKVKHIADEWTSWEIDYVERGVDQQAAEKWISFWDPNAFPASDWSAERMRDFMRQARIIEGGVPSTAMIINATTLPMDKPSDSDHEDGDTAARPPPGSRSLEQGPKPLCRATRQQSVVDWCAEFAPEEEPTTSAISGQPGAPAGALPPLREVPSDALAPPTQVPTGLVHLQHDNACFCGDHDASAKRHKQEPAMKVCEGCHAHLLTNYAQFAYCPPCSGRHARCMICGYGVPKKGAKTARPGWPGVVLPQPRADEETPSETPTTAAGEEETPTMGGSGGEETPAGQAGEVDLIDLGGPPSPRSVNAAEPSLVPREETPAADEAPAPLGVGMADLDDVFRQCLAVEAPASSAEEEAPAAATAAGGADNGAGGAKGEELAPAAAPVQDAEPADEGGIEKLRDAVLHGCTDDILGVLDKCGPLVTPKYVESSEPVTPAKAAASSGDRFAAFDELQPKCASPPAAEPGALVTYGAGPIPPPAMYDPSSPMQLQLEPLDTRQLASLQVTIAQILQHRKEAREQAQAALAAGPVDLPQEVLPSADENQFDDLLGSFCSKYSEWGQFRPGAADSEAPAEATQPEPAQEPRAPRAARRSICVMVAPARAAGADAREPEAMKALGPEAMKAEAELPQPDKFGDLLSAFSEKSWGMPLPSKVET